MDRIIFIAMSLIVVITTLFVGDPMYVGIWYYVAIPLVEYLIVLPFKPKQYFLTGIGLATLLTYIPYFYHNLFSTRPEGLVGLGHLFSLPGLAVGILLAMSYLKIKSTATGAFYILSVSFTIALFGFLINQFILCNTVMYCGGLMWPLNLMTKG